MRDGEATEQSLVRAAQGGDRAAFDELVSRHKISLYRFARRYIGDGDDAYDILQNTFVAAWLALPRCDSAQPFGAWLRTIALNKCRDHGRRRAARNRFLALFASEERASGAGRNDPADADLEPAHSRYLRQLDQAIADLPRRYKEPLLLTLITGLTQRQAAEQLGTSVKAVEIRIRRAKQRLGKQFSAQAEQQSASIPREFLAK